MRSDPNCDHCGEVETMEHLLCKCEHFSEPLWNRFSEVIKHYLNANTIDLTPSLKLGQHNSIFNVPQPSLLLHVHDKITKSVFIFFTQEIKRDNTIQMFESATLGRTIHGTTMAKSSFGLHNMQTLLQSAIHWTRQVSQRYWSIVDCTRHQHCLIWSRVSCLFSPFIMPIIFYPLTVFPVDQPYLSCPLLPKFRVIGSIYPSWRL